MKIVLGVLWSRARFRLARPGPVRGVRRSITLAPARGTEVFLDATVVPRRAAGRAS
jgi:hypothetical protein